VIKLGVQMWPTDYSASPVDVAVAAEERGFESFFVPDHTHIPVSRASPYPEGGELPREYPHLLDALTALTAAAAATTRIRIGTAVCLVIERDPIILAKQVASIDYLSGGRFEFGASGGWNREEMANHGISFEDRWRVLQERIEAMRVIWNEDEAEYHGRYVDFDPIWSWPKPIQRPGPPVLLGGSGQTVMERITTYGDGWIPVRRWEGENFFARVDLMRDLARQRGRPEPAVTVVGVNPKREVLAELEDRGIHRALISLPVTDRDETYRRLDRYAELLKS
jgi:probable F420-dependent oxidoreductase